MGDTFLSFFNYDPSKLFFNKRIYRIDGKFVVGHNFTEVVKPLLREEMLPVIEWMKNNFRDPTTNV